MTRHHELGRWRLRGADDEAGQSELFG